MEKWEVITFSVVLDMPIFMKDILQAYLIPVAMIWHFTINKYIYICVCVWNELQLSCI